MGRARRSIFPDVDMPPCTRIGFPTKARLADFGERSWKIQVTARELRVETVLCRIYQQKLYDIVTVISL